MGTMYFISFHIFSYLFIAHAGTFDFWQKQKLLLELLPARITRMNQNSEQDAQDKTTVDSLSQVAYPMIHEGPGGAGFLRQ